MSWTTVPLVSPEAPYVATGAEELIGRSAIATAELPGRVEATGVGFVDVKDYYLLRHRFGPPEPTRTSARLDWIPAVEPGDQVSRGTVIAHAPDVVIDGGTPRLALGVNLLTAATPWFGLDFEDAVVVSESAAGKLAHDQRVVVREELQPDDWVLPLAEVGEQVATGRPVAVVQRGESLTWAVAAPEGGRLDAITVDRERGHLSVTLTVRRGLEVGDKLSNRHAGKGVVARIVPDHLMPQVAALGRAVELIVNPLGILRRLNVGQVFEMGVGLEGLLSGTPPAIVGRRLTDREGLARRLADSGATDGRLPLTAADGAPLFAGAPVLVGPQYVLKLGHHARDKLSVRADGRFSRWRQQPSAAAYRVAGRKIGGAQRLGEMEIWGLLAAGATAVVSEALAPDVGRAGGRGRPAERGTWRATVAHLGAAGFDVAADLDGDDPVVSVHPYADCDLAALDAFSAAELQSIAAARRSGVPWEFEAVHPLYDQRHGSGVERFGLRRCFDLSELSRDDGRDGPVAVHPWTGTPLTRLPVLPPEFRGFGFDDLDRLYIGIGALIAPPIPPRRGQTKNEQAGWQGSTQDRTDLQQLIDRLLGGWRVGKRHELDTGIYHRLAHKRGLLRRYLLGTSRNASARGVIVPDPDLPIEAVGLPATAYDALIGTSSDSVVIINRQPTLRPANLIALRARRIEGHAITLHPQLLEPLAGDFDGDTVAVHRPVTAPARNQAWAMLRPARNMRNPAHGRLAVKSDLDLALGHQLQPTGQELRDRVELALASAPNDPCVGLATLQSELWRAASGWSFGLLELSRLSPEADESPVDTLHRSLARPEFADLATVIAAGAVKPEVLTALLLEHRPAPSFNPFLPALLPGGCFLDGLVDDPYAAKARSGQARLAEKKLLTPLAGAVTKSLVEIAYEVVISVPDCGSLQRGPLSCAYADPCQACYGTVPGESEPAAIGRRVGILAGMVIGERATQLAMKTFHAGGSQTVDVAELRALLGHGASRLLGDRARRRSGKPIGLQKYLARVEARTPEDLQPVVDLVVASLQGDVAAVHVQVMLRQLWEARALPGPAGRWLSLAARAETGGRDGLVLATSRGSVEMINAERAGGPRQGARLGLMVQGGR